MMRNSVDMGAAMRKIAWMALAGVLTCLSAQQAFAWTQPVVISGSGNTGCSIAKIARSSTGKLYVAFRRKNPDWRIMYRERSAGGYWGPVESVSVPWSERADIIEDPVGRPHMFYTGTGAGGDNDLFEAYRDSGSWFVTQFTNTTGYHEDYPRMATDSTGRIHLVYTKSADGDHGNVIYRVWNGTWSGETSIGSIGGTAKVYYHRPDICVDAANNVHVVWEQDPYTLVYRRLSAGSWSATQALGTTTQFFSYAKIAAAAGGGLVAVTFDQQTASQAVLKYSYSTNGGVSWAGLQYLCDGHYPSMDTGADGVAHLVYEWMPGAKATGYRSWDGSWSVAQQASSTAYWQGWADVVAEPGGVLHVVYDENEGISYVSSAPDAVAPKSPSGFSASTTDSSARLSWTNPDDPDTQGTVVRVRTDGYPASPTDGSPVCDVSGGPGQAGAFNHTGLTNGATYYYSAFAYDPVRNYSPAVHAVARPAAASCASVKQSADGAPVDLRGRIVTAGFVTTDGCVYVEDPDRQSGIRVATTQTGFAVGDIVDISGAMGTRILSTRPAERQISGATLTKTGFTNPLRPLAMTCMTVGGSADGLVPGVQGGLGLNNMGLLVTIFGKVTYKAGSYIYVDDGSRVANLYGISTPVTGVMVRLPSTPSVNVGDMVSVTGVVEGSIPSSVEWTTNRRYLHARTMQDLVVR